MRERCPHCGTILKVKEGPGTCGICSGAFVVHPDPVASADQSVAAVLIVLGLVGIAAFGGLLWFSGALFVGGCAASICSWLRVVSRRLEGPKIEKVDAVSPP